MSLPRNGLLSSCPSVGQTSLIPGGGNCYGAARCGPKRTKTGPSNSQEGDSYKPPPEAESHMTSGASRKYSLPDSRRRQREMQEQLMLASMRLQATMDDMVRLNDKIAMIQDDNQSLKEQLKHLASRKGQASSPADNSAYMTGRTYQPNVRGSRRAGGYDTIPMTTQNPTSTRPVRKADGSNYMLRGVAGFLRKAANLCSKEPETSDHDEAKS